jgi:hypothetical protein
MELERQPQGQLNIPAFIGRSSSSARRSALLSLDEIGCSDRRSRSCRKRTNVEISVGDVKIVVVEDVVELAAELQAKSFIDLEVLIEARVEIPKARPEELIPIRVRRTAGCVCATYMVESRANRNSLSIPCIGYAV